jgi:large subunit ribosomal protein L10
MALQDKVARAEELTKLLQESKGMVIVDYRGLNVADISALRRRLRDQGVELRVAKNTLLRRAADATGIADYESLLAGPTAIASSDTDEVAPARLMTEAARVPRTPISIRGGIYGRRGVSAAAITSIAELPSREVMLARAVGVVQAPAAAVLSLVQAPARQVLNAVVALQKMQEAA